jgi:hypothetical protein
MQKYGGLFLHIPQKVCNFAAKCFTNVLQKKVKNMATFKAVILPHHKKKRRNV